MVRLGNHPEATVCIRCAHSLSKRAWELEDRDRTSLASRTRDAFRSLRKTVVQRGWHHTGSWAATSAGLASTLRDGQSQRKRSTVVSIGHDRQMMARRPSR